MHDENIGQRCEVCKLRDYVPYHCRTCNRKLCNQHYWSKEEHPCIIVLNDGKMPATNKKQNYFCTQCNCKLFTVNHYYCQTCQKLFCLKHRHPEQHKCQQPSSSCLIM